MTRTFSGISPLEAPMDRLVVEVGEEEVAVRGPDTAGAKAVAADAKTASATTTRGVREIMTMCTSSSEDQARRSLFVVE